MSQSQDSYSTIGTTTPIFVPRTSDPKPVCPGQDYFFVQIQGAQAAFRGSIWQHADNLTVATKVNIHHPILGNDNLRAIQRTRKVQRNRAEQLGLRPNLISLIPAVMPDFSISVDFILNSKNYLGELGGLINSDAFLATISLAPGAAMVAKTVSGLAGKIIETFVPAEEREPILQFSGDFNLSSNQLKDGYYVILGSRDVDNPLPNPLPSLQVKDGELLSDGDRVTQLSYVIINVQSTPVRTRAFNDGATWEIKLQEIEDEASRIGHDPLATDDERRNAWEKCRGLLKEAQTLLRNDPNYHRHEAESIVRSVLSQAAKDLDIQLNSQGSGGIVKASRGSNKWQPNMIAERQLFEISPSEDLEKIDETYSIQASEARQLLFAAGL